jgi:hypothetical protein
MVAGYILLLGLNIPFLDQWAFVHLLSRQQQHTLTLADLLAQHNEHRPFFPRLIWLALSGPTRYNVNAQLWVNALLALGTFVFFVRRAVRAWARLDLEIHLLTVPLMSLLVFNLGQRESWLQGFQTVMFLGTACAVMGLLLLSDDSGWGRYFVALVLGVIATFSVAHGLLFWPAGLLLLTASARDAPVKYEHLTETAYHHVCRL